MMTLDKVYSAELNLKSVVRKTDLIYAPKLTKNAELYLKTENLQKTGSFKLRGAYNKISQLTEEEREKGVVACSAGNHAQGVAVASKALGAKSLIFLPSTAPISKVEATRLYGAEVRLIDGVYDDAYQAAIKYGEENDKIFIHPFDDDEVIAGQGTIALEIIDQLPDVEAIVVPIGGGGLISGIAYTIKAIKPDCKVYGVQAEGASAMRNSFNKENICATNAVSTFADGIAVKCPGLITHQMINEYVDDIVTVSEDEIATAVLSLMENQKLVAEGAGAVATAAILFDKLPLKGKKVCSILSGGNIDVNILSRVIERGLMSSGRRTILAIELIDAPGQLQNVSRIIAEKGANVVNVHYSPGGENMAIDGCYLHLGLETRDNSHLKEVEFALENNGYKVMN